MSVIGLDIGEKRIGVALGTVLAEEYDTLEVKSPAKTFFDETGKKQAIDYLLSIIRRERAERLVIGLPANDNRANPLNKKISDLTEELSKILDIPVATVDETLTSFAAEQILRDEGLTIKEAKLRVDQVAAKLILQQYLEENS